MTFVGVSVGVKLASLDFLMNSCIQDDLVGSQIFSISEIKTWLANLEYTSPARFTIGLSVTSSGNRNFEKSKDASLTPSSVTSSGNRNFEKSKDASLTPSLTPSS